MSKPTPPTPSYWRLAADAIRANVTSRIDAFVNVHTGLGGSRDRRTHAYVGPFRPLQVQELTWLFHGSDLPAVMVERLPDEAFRLGFEVDDPALGKALARWDAPGKLLEAAVWGRLYGGAAVFLGMSDRLGRQSDPLDLSKVGPGDLKFLDVLDRNDLSVSEYDSAGRPRFYGITGMGRSEIHVHPSRLIVFGGARTAYTVRIENGGWDLSVLQRPIDVLRDVDQAWGSVMFLLQDLSQAVIKIKDLTSMITEGRKNVVMDRMEVVDMARSVARAMVLDADQESFEHVGAQNLTGVDPLLIRVFQRLAAAAEMPLTVLLGVSPAGLNATGDSDIRLWYAQAEKYRRKITPQVLGLTRLIARSEGLKPPSSVRWPSLWTPTEMEKIDMDSKEAATDAARITSQVLTAEEVALVRYGGKSWAEVVDVGAREAALLAADNPEPEAIETEDEADPYQPGTIWIDTDDEHRLQITAADRLRIYYKDLDSDKPGRQWAWARASFQERCSPAPAPVEAPGPGQAPGEGQ